MFGILNNNEIEELLEKQSIGRIGCHADGKTYVVPVSYVYYGNNICCHSHEGMKINMMHQNPEVCFETDTLSNPELWKSVITWGTFEEVTNKGERDNILNVMLGKGLIPGRSKTMKLELGLDYPFPPDDLNKITGIIFRIKIHEKTGRYELKEDTVNYITG